MKMTGMVLLSQSMGILLLLALLIMTTIQLGIAGGIVGLAMINGVGALLGAIGLGGFHQPFDMISMLGFLILMGTVVNNPILIVDRAIQRLREADITALGIWYMWRMSLSWSDLNEARKIGQEPSGDGGSL